MGHICPTKRRRKLGLSCFRGAAQPTPLARMCNSQSPAGRSVRHNGAMEGGVRLVIVLCVAIAAMPAWGQQYNCDCTQIIGACEASIRWEPTGSAGSYGAKLRITSTAPICSKVSYYVDSTPYFNILSRGNTDEDSVFGTKPFTAETLSDIKCQVCKQAAAVSPSTANTPHETPANATPSDASPFAGTWVGTERTFFGKTWNITLKLRVKGNSADGTWASEQGTHPFGGSTSGSQLTGAVGPGPAGSGSPRFTLNLVGADILEYSYLFISGTLRKQE